MVSNAMARRLLQFVKQRLHTVNRRVEPLSPVVIIGVLM
jgi:hypothetical protein